MYKVIIRNLRKPGLFLDWDMEGESTFATVKGAQTRRKVVARKFRAYDTGVLTPGGHIIDYQDATHPELAVAQPATVKKRKLTPRI